MEANYLPIYLFPIKLSEFEPDNKNILIFNTINQFLVEVTNDEFSSIQNYYTGSQKYNVEFIRELLDTELLDSEIKIKNKVNSRIIIIPTMSCNKSCSYCYHAKNINKTISITNIPILFEYVKDFISSKNHIEKVSVIWHGGEPLVSFNVLKKISHSLSEYFQKENIIYEESLLTNGILLTKNYCNEIIIHTSINEFQISIDNNTSPNQLERIINYSQHLLHETNYMRIFIKYNLIESNFDLVYPIIDKLKKVSSEGRLFFRLGYLESHGDLETAKNIGYEEFIDKHWKLSDFLRENKIGWEPELPEKIFSACSANDVNSITIGPELNTYRCNVNVPFDKWKIYDIKNKKYYNNADAEKEYIQYSPFTDEKCSRCHIVHNCMGGCHVKRIYKQRTEDFCKGTIKRLQWQIYEYYKYNN